MNASHRGLVVGQASGTVSMAVVLERGVVLQPFEAVAIVQQLIRKGWDVVIDGERAGPPSPGDVSLRADGTVIWTGSDAMPSVSEVAVLLQMLMTGSTRIPGGIQYAIARALNDVEGASFDSVQEFSSVLERHERRDRAAVLRAVAGRVTRMSVMPSIAGVQPASRQAVAAAGSERRSTPPLVTELRRQLRTADQALFENRGPVTRARPGGRAWMRRVPPIVGGLTAGLVVALSAETVRLYRGPALPMAAPPTASIPVTPAAAPLPPPPLPASLQLERTETARVATAGPSEPRPTSVRAENPTSVRAERRRVLKKTNTSRSQKPKRRRFLGIPFFTS